MPREDKAKLLDDASVGDGHQDPEHLLGEVTGNILEEKNADLQFPISKPKLTFEPLDPCDSKPGYGDVIVITGVQPPVKKPSSCCAGRWTRVVVAVALLSVIVMLVLGITGVIPLGLHRRPGKINFDPSTDLNVQKQIVDFERLAEPPRKLEQGEDPEANEKFDQDNSGPGQIDPIAGYESSVGSGVGPGSCAKHGPGGPGRGWEPGRGRHSGKGPDHWRGRHSGRGPWRERHSGQGPDHGPGPLPGGPRPWPAEVYPVEGPDHVPVPQQPGQGPQQPGQVPQQMGKELERNFKAVKEQAVNQINKLGEKIGQILAAPVTNLCPDGTTNCNNVLQVSPLEPLPAVDAGKAKELVGRALAAIQLPAQN